MSYLHQTPLATLGEPVPAAPQGPVFDLNCAGACAPFTDAQCRGVLQRAILDAIALANNAAQKLEASAPDAETVRLFRFFFGHPPSTNIPWADNTESRVSVAKRFRAAANELNGGRRTQYSCVCAPTAPAGRRGETRGPLDVRLCPAFWRPAGLRVSDRFFRAGVVLHEMIHQLFGEFLHDVSTVSMRVNAHCYEAFAMRLAGHAADPSDVRRCRPDLFPAA
ncbi:MAG TPA: hypothetical protein VMN56_02500 [Casimicrobiaceae bacterium]|nr:hypothetical protein [Casimicrobiaceae bacterium]